MLAIACIYFNTHYSLQSLVLYKYYISNLYLHFAHSVRIVLYSVQTVHCPVLTVGLYRTVYSCTVYSDLSEYIGTNALRYISTLIL